MENEDERQSAPVYRESLLYFDALRLVALRKGDGIEEALATESEREFLIRAPAHVHSAHANSKTNTNPYGTEASAAGRSGRACVARAVNVERGGMGERGCARRLGGGCWGEANSS